MLVEQIYRAQEILVAVDFDDTLLKIMLGYLLTAWHVTGDDRYRGVVKAFVFDGWATAGDEVAKAGKDRPVYVVTDRFGRDHLAYDLFL